MNKKNIIALIAAAIMFGLAGVIVYVSTRPTTNKKNPDKPGIAAILAPDDSSSDVVYPTTPVTLTYWRTWDGSAPIEAIIADYHKLHPNIDIQVKDIPYGSYDEQLTAAAKSGTLPDMYTVLNDWIPRYIDQSVPAPETVYSEKTYRSVFVDVAANRLVTNGKINGVTFGVSTLGLFYNPILLKDANIEVPKDWDEFVEASRKLTKTEGTIITQSGAALGTPYVHQAVDIMSALMLQNGAQMTDSPPTKALFAEPDKAGYSPGAKALDFYTSFARPGKQNYSYNDALGYTVKQFADGKSAMMLNYPFKGTEVRQFNPQMKYGTSKMPQIKGETAVNFAQYWVEMVNKKSGNAEIAWDFLRFAATKDEQKVFNKTTLRPTSRKDLLSEEKNDSDIGAFAQQTDTALIFYRGNDHDMNGFFFDATTSILSGVDPILATKTAQTRASNLIATWPYK